MPKVREPRRQICMYTGGTGRRFRTFTVLEFPAARKNIPYSRHYSLKIVVFNPLLEGALFLVLHEIYEPVHGGSSSICWVLVRDLAIDMHFFGVIGFLCMKTTS